MIQKISLFCSFWLCFTLHVLGQYQYRPGQVEILRDSFGVPHIYGKTDADAAYGLAWAHSEDDFQHIQHNLLAGRGRLAEVKGKEGALMDFALQFFQIDSLVEARFERDLSPDFKLILEAYVQGLNDYAAKHPKEVLLPKALPFSPKDVIKSYTLIGVLLAGGGMSLKAINDDIIPQLFAPNERGSNSIALAPHRTEDGKAWLLVNSHQPIEGAFAWYEAHINSEQGWNIVGGLFPGGVSAFIGTTPQLGWAHTTNYHNFNDVFLLKVDKQKKHYWYDGRWEAFHFRKAKLRVKLLGGLLKLRIKKRIPMSTYGPVFVKKHGWYAIRHPATTDIRSAEQWYRMNKAQNFEQFEAALRMQALPLFNVIYADVQGNIFLSSEGKIPKRDTCLTWCAPIPAGNPEHKWKELLPYEDKIKYLNPSCGFLYNANGTPLKSTCWEENSRSYFVGLQLFEYNRHERLGGFLNSHQGLFTWDDWRCMKYDKAYDLHGSYARNFAPLYELSPEKHRRLAPAIERLRAWNFTGEMRDSLAALPMICNEYIAESTKMPYGFLMIRNQKIEEKVALHALRRARRYLLRRFGRLDVPLGEVQRLVRGQTSLPVGGLAEVLRAVDVKFDKKRKIFKMYSGDGYMQMARFGRDGVQLETISPYGASSKPKSPHYTDQMELFVQEKTKPMPLDRKAVEAMSKRRYRPGE
jgi:acyl-homoserine-lactone acylase